MAHRAYRDVVVDCSTPPDTTGLKGKSVVITGGKWTLHIWLAKKLTLLTGAHGMGAATVRGFSKFGSVLTQSRSLHY